MLLVASFALGVEKGKLTAKREEAPPAPVIASAPTEAAAPVRTAAISSPEKETPAAKEGNSAVTAQKKEEQAQAEPAQTGPAASGYTIQIASVQSPSAAQALAESLTKKGFNSFTKVSGKYVVVLAGNFTKREDAQGSLKELKKTFSDCYIKKI
jgi:cell division septation protein DedD